MYGWYSFFAFVALLFVAAAVLMYKTGYRPRRRERTVVRVRVRAPGRRENVYRRVKRKQEEQRKA